MPHPVLAEILGPDLIVIVVIIALLFGSSQVPKLARSLGQAKKEFEQGIAEGHAPAEPPAEPPAEQVTMTKAELDALLAEREAAARRQVEPTPPPSAES
jgi:sec-independent protein translocase protein TatA